MDVATESARKTALVVHQDPGALDALTRALESHGFEVIAALGAFRAQTHLEGERPIHIVIAQWDDEQSVGGDVYKWSLQRRYDLRSQFVFVGDGAPADFDQLVVGRCLMVSLSRIPEILQVAEAAVMRIVRLSEQPFSEVTLNVEAPTLLLADDEPVLLMVMTNLLKQAGYQVTPVDSGNSAIAQLTTQDFDVILADWHMDDGSGADLFLWISERRPDLVERLVFLSGGALNDAQTIAPGRPVFPKGQDSAALTKVLDDIVRSVRDEEWR
jgi:CheY-like chemotaxis protein